MHDPRSESRMKFLQPSLIDPRNKLKQLKKRQKRKKTENNKRNE